ncbi:MAG TPA: hypothetical protein VGJ26_02525 [Pirellulales bacterium]|jgi:hypothetical protein
MFVAVTLLAIPLGWLAWQERLVRNRQAMRRQIEQSGGAVFVQDMDWLSSGESRTIRAGNYGSKVSSLRRWLGDERADFICFDRQLTDEDRRAISAFSEAEITAIP